MSVLSVLVVVDVALFAVNFLLSWRLLLLADGGCW